MSTGLTATRPNNVNSILATSQNNIKLEKELKNTKATAPKPNISSNEEKKKGNNLPQALMATSTIGILLMQGAMLLKKPEKFDTEINALSEQVQALAENLENLTQKMQTNETLKIDDKIISKFQTALDGIKNDLTKYAQMIAQTGEEEQIDAQIISNINEKIGNIDSGIRTIQEKLTKQAKMSPVDYIYFKDGIAISRLTEKPVNETVEKTLDDNAKYEITFSDGRLSKSEKINADGIVLSTKTYEEKEVESKINGKVLQKKINYEENFSPISKIQISQSKNGKILSSSQSIKYPLAKTTKEEVSFVRNENGNWVLYNARNGKNTIHALKFGFITTKENVPFEYDSALSNTENGYTISRIKKSKK